MIHTHTPPLYTSLGPHTQLGEKPYKPVGVLCLQLRSFSKGL